MKAAEFRQAILQAAVQGKLVPQNVHDEPALELLKRIQQEKAQLVKQGNIKKEKPLPFVAEDEILYDLPDGWVGCRLGDICSHIADIDHNMPPAVEQGVLFLSAKDLLDNGTINYTSKVKFISEQDYERLGRKVKPQRNDIIYSRIGACLGKARIVESDAKFLVSYSCCTIRPLSLDLKYLCRYLGCGIVLRQATRDTQSIGVPDLGLQKIKEFYVPLPPLAEQQRIVAKVDELMALCDELEAAEKELDALESRFVEYLPKSILRAAVQGKLVPQNVHDEPASELLERIRQEKARLIKEGKIKKEKPLPPIAEEEIPYDLPDEWAWCRLSNILHDNIGGGTPSKQNPDYWNGDIHWASVKDLNCDILTTTIDMITEKGLNESSSKLIAKDNIIICTRMGLGKIAINHIPVAINQDLRALILPKDKVDCHFLIYWYRTLSLIGGGMTVKGIKNEEFVKMVFPLPPLAEQRRIVAKVDELIALCDELKSAPINIPLKAAASIIPFPRHVPDEASEQHEQLFAARGEGDTLPQEAFDDLAALYGDDNNA